MSRSRPRKSKSRRQAQHVTRTPKCPTPRKLAWNTRESAETALRYSHHQGREYRPERVYLCGCGKWHATSRPAYRSGEGATG